MAEEAGEPRRGETKGWLYKWTNYLKGYQKRWFVLAQGVLSYHHSQAEVSHTCRGTLPMNGAVISTAGDGANFMVSNGSGTKTFHLRAASESERQRWVTSLELAKSSFHPRRPLPGSEEGKGREEGEEDEEEDEEELMEMDKAQLVNAVKMLTTKMGELATCSGLIERHVGALQGALTELSVTLEGVGAAGEGRALVPALRAQTKTCLERGTLLKVTANAMVKAGVEFTQHCQYNGRRWQAILVQEREQRQRLEEMVEQLARQHSHLEALVKRSTGETPALVVAPEPRTGVTSNSGTDDEFEDALEHPNLYDVMTVTAPPGFTAASDLHTAASDASGGSKDEDDDLSSSLEDEDDHEKNELRVIRKKDARKRRSSGSQASGEQSSSSRPMTPVQQKSWRPRRTRIPDKPDKPISLWNIVKNCIGKDLTKIPVPVNFSEPLSMLQRLTEDFEYSAILDKAAECSNSCEQLAYVAAFTVSSYSTTAIRVGKPFNPLLGETFEYDREDLGFRCVSEQVSHHPPMVAQYAESTTGLWRCWQEFSMRSKFKGKYLEVEPLGIAHLTFERSGNHYTWRKVKTVVHNIVIGKLWVDQHGEMSVVNHTNGDKCHMKFEPYSYFGGTAKKVSGTVINAQDKVEWVLNGTWDTNLEGSRVISETKVKGKSSLEIGPSRTLWKVNPIAPGAEKYHSFSRFACELNESEEGVAPTDSRRRPDQRLMENGEWDAANDEKLRLEEKQRTVRKSREEEAAQAAQKGESWGGYKPLWFESREDEMNGGKMTFVYQGGYWESKDNHDWAPCPDIF
eukprot:snap_masked-scaffold190_size271632-processed-gene-1.1 protein:Tk12379 transcript:snap_masked-scaffold190_size271632-processed-gene-1.1-mRNA-1 annotation:"hypothetical protein DAPPUDRAFT_315619"